MIDKLVQSALKTGWLSVESEGLIRQVIRMRGCMLGEAESLHRLLDALDKGDIQREGQGTPDDLLQLTKHSISPSR